MSNSIMSDGNEVAAVFEVIQSETRAFYNKDFEACASCWAHAPYIRRLDWWTRGGVTDRSGWDQIGERMRQQFLDYPDYNRTAGVVQHENLVIRVRGDLAYATYDQWRPDTGEPDMDMAGLSREAKILERHDGEWRIVFLTYIHHTAEPARPPMLRMDGRGQLSR